MLKPAEILDFARRKWPHLLRAEVAGDAAFPLRIPFGRPAPSSDFAVLRADIESLAGARIPWRIEWEEVDTRKWGRQRLPIRLEFDSLEDVAKALGVMDELGAFRSAIRHARAHCPTLEPWLKAKAHRVLDYLADWNGLVAVCAYFHANPRPRCYPRQIPVPVGTKFIEEHAAILRELLDVVVGESVNVMAATFAERFHLLTEPPQVRFRFLDHDLRIRVCWPVEECAIPAPAFADLRWQISRVIIIENRDVFVCLPNVADTLAIFGAGKASSLLATCQWMKSSEIVYWGDCDEAGYGILSSLRQNIPHVRSLLMNHEAWTQWKHLAVPGKRDPSVKHTCLTASEKEALSAVVAGPWMLEQERIPLAEAERAVRTVFSNDRFASRSQ